MAIIRIEILIAPESDTFRFVRIYFLPYYSVNMGVTAQARIAEHSGKTSGLLLSSTSIRLFVIVVPRFPTLVGFNCD